MKKQLFGARLTLIIIIAFFVVSSFSICLSWMTLFPYKSIHERIFARVDVNLVNRRTILAALLIVSGITL